MEPYQNQLKLYFDQNFTTEDMILLSGIKQSYG